MRYLYLDNYRGFSNTIVPIKSVNFFVGENSTGKTSILALLYLLASPRFWASQDFNTEYYDFGDFGDIVSANAADKSVFCFGYCSLDSGRGGRDARPQVALLTYAEQDGLPQLSHYSQLFKDRIASIVITKTSCKYRVDQFSAKIDDEASIMEAFRQLKRIQRVSGAKYKKMPIDIPPRQAIFPLLAMLGSLAEGKEPDFEELSFSLPLFPPDMVWFAPIRTKPRRTYDGYGKPYSPDGEHTPYLLRKELAVPKAAEDFHEALTAFGKESGLFREIKIRQFNRDATSPFELHVVLSKKSLRLNSVGYGLSQSLPVVAELLVRRNGAWYAIQQPEVHLHPRAQAALGDLVVQLALNEKKKFVIETHSDFTIDRFRRGLRGKKAGVSAQVLFFERSGAGNKVSPIEIMSNGEYSSDQPSTFRQFFLHEQMDNLGL